MYKFAEETSLETLEECYPLCKQHFQELTEGQSFDVDWDTLKALLSYGSLVITVARVEGEVVAYYMNVVNKDFLTSTLVSKELAIFVQPKHRGGRLFLKLSKFNTEVLVSKGVVTQFITFMHGHNDKLPLKMGFEPLEITYKKVIGDK